MMITFLLYQALDDFAVNEAWKIGKTKDIIKH